MKAVSADKAKDLLKSGQFVTVTFTKKDGTVRVLNGRAGVRKGVKGVGMNYNADDKGIVILYEVNNPAENPSDKYRAVRIASIVNFKHKGQEYTIAR